MENLNQQLKAFKPIELTDEQRKLLNRISMKAIGIMAIFDAILLFLCIKDGISFFPFPLFMIVFVNGLVLLFELRDKIALKKYEKLYITVAYIKNSVYMRNGRRVSLVYYDFIQDLILPLEKGIEYSDSPNQELKTGAFIYILMGSKSNKLNYISPRPSGI